MTTQQKISEIISTEWNNYLGYLFQQKLFEHAELRKEIGDDMFLLYLEQQRKLNPRPKFEVPNELKHLINT